MSLFVLPSKCSCEKKCNEEINYKKIILFHLVKKSLLNIIILIMKVRKFKKPLFNKISLFKDSREKSKVANIACYYDSMIRAKKKIKPYNDY